MKVPLSCPTGLDFGVAKNVTLHAVRPHVCYLHRVAWELHAPACPQCPLACIDPGPGLRRLNDGLKHRPGEHSCLNQDLSPCGSQAALVKSPCHRRPHPAALLSRGHCLSLPRAWSGWRATSSSRPSSTCRVRGLGGGASARAVRGGVWQVPQSSRACVAHHARIPAGRRPCTACMLPVLPAQGMTACLTVRHAHSTSPSCLALPLQLRAPSTPWSTRRARR